MELLVEPVERCRGMRMRNPRASGRLRYRFCWLKENLRGGRKMDWVTWFLGLTLGQQVVLVISPIPAIFGVITFLLPTSLIRLGEKGRFRQLYPATSILTVMAAGLGGLLAEGLLGSTPIPKALMLGLGILAVELAMLTGTLLIEGELVVSFLEFRQEERRKSG